MTAEALQKYLSQIKPLDAGAMAKARARLDGLAKPPGSLGKLENIAARLAGISGKTIYNADKRCVIIMASDNGVVEEGVSSAPQSVTYMQTLNFAKGLTGVSVIAKQFNADLIVVDVGINADIGHPLEVIAKSHRTAAPDLSPSSAMPMQFVDLQEVTPKPASVGRSLAPPASCKTGGFATGSLVKNRKIRKSTWNIALREAMTYDEAVQSINIGIDAALEAVKDGYTLLGAGEMGIGNTTTSAAVLCALTGISAYQATDRGAGLNSKAYRQKIEVIGTALKNNNPDASDPIDVLAKVGGFDIAAMAGIYIGAAYARVPVVIDGFISMVAALAASRLNPLVKEFMFPSHASNEQGFAHAAAALGMDAPLNLNMRLGEGSGCPIMFALIDAACAIIRDMGTFEDANIDEQYLDKIKGGDVFPMSNK